MTINKCSINDLASYDPGLELFQACNSSPLPSTASQFSSFKIENKVDPLFGFLMHSPETFIPTAFRAPEIAKPVSPGIIAGALALLGKTAIADGVAGMIMGPGALLQSPEPPALDFRLSLLRQQLTDVENDALTDLMIHHPEGDRIVSTILNARVDQQPGLVRIVLEKGERAPTIASAVEESAQAGSGTAPVASAAEDKSGQKKTCPADMVFASSVNLCVDEHEFTDPGSVMPKVNVKLAEAAALCAAQKVGSGVKRLPTSDEWYRIASKGGKQTYSNRIGNRIDIGVHYKSDSARTVCAARGHYIEYDGKEICDMSGNVGEWTADSFVSGGWFDFQVVQFLRADYRSNVVPYDSSDKVGFRCVAAPRDSTKK